MAAETKLRKYIHVHNTAKLLQIKEYVLPLNIQMNTNVYADLSFGSLLTWQEGLASVLFLVTTPFRKETNFSTRYMVQHLLAASMKYNQPCL